MKKFFNSKAFAYLTGIVLGAALMYAHTHRLVVLVDGSGILIESRDFYKGYSKAFEIQEYQHAELQNINYNEPNPCAEAELVILDQFRIQFEAALAAAEREHMNWYDAYILFYEQYMSYAHLFRNYGAMDRRDFESYY